MFTMKKTIALLTLAVGFTSAAHAQEGIRFGVKAGLNYSSYSGSGAKYFSSKLGGLAGVTANFGITDMFSVQPEVLYSMKGAKYEQAVGSGAGAYTVKTIGTAHYIDVPVLLRASFGGPFVEVGPQANFLLAADSKDDGSTAGFVRSDATDTDQYNKVQFGYVLGVGYQLESGLSLGVRYNGDISKTLDESKFTTGYNDVRNSVFQFQVGYAFGGQ
jgi:hypothetical protein